MRFALVGANADALELARAIAASREHVLVAAYDARRAGEESSPELVGVPVATDWESFLTPAAADAVIIAPGADPGQRAEQSRRLVQAAVPLIVCHPFDESMLLHYELEMIQRDTQCVIVPYLRYRWHPGLARLRGVIESPYESGVGAIEQIVLERYLDDRSRGTVLAHLAGDIDLAAFLAGELNRVMAMSGAAAPGAYASLGVQLSGVSGIAVRWVVQPLESDRDFQVSILGAQGTATWRERRSRGSSIVQIGTADAVELRDVRPAEGALAALAQAVGGAAVEPTWTAAARAMELVDAVERSLSKGRGIEVYFTEHTEHETFKGLMSGLGCVLLCAAPLMAAGGAALARLLGLPVAWIIPYILLAVFVLFLGLQVLQLLFPREKHDRANTDDCAQFDGSADRSTEEA